MNILGINYGHNATVGLLQDGRITFCQSEERLSRLENSTGFPHRTLEHVYREFVPPENIDLAVLYQDSVYGYLYLKRAGFQAHQVSGYFDPGAKPNLKQPLLRHQWAWKLRQRRIALNEGRAPLAREARAYFSGCLRLPADRIATLDHHLCHAYSAVPNIQDWGETLVFTLDGVGDWKCATVSKWADRRLDVLSTDEHMNSLGYFYATVTSWMGMKAGEHEFKVMGLAPYAKKEYYEKLTEQLRRLLWVGNDGNWHTSITPIQLPDAFDRIFRFQRFDNIAGAVQEFTESEIVRWILHWVNKTGVRRIALSGGVFMNVKACQRIAERTEIERIFVVPSAGDESTVIGCAVWGALKLEHSLQIAPLSHLYLGMQYDDSAIEQSIAETSASDRYEIERPDNINARVADLLADNEVVARCTGRMEFGARALGNRSILANPSRFENLRLINDAVKSRDFWMPFTPSILDVDMPRYIVGHEKVFAPYMCITFDSTPAARKDLVAAVHPRDFTVRPQCVNKGWNPDYYEIISGFKARTGIGGVLNTSFNLHGEPNVGSPADAIRTVDNSGLERLALGSFLLTKRAR